VFFAIAQVFGAVGPVLFGTLIGTGDDPSRLFIGYAIGGGSLTGEVSARPGIGIPAGPTRTARTWPHDRVPRPVGRGCHVLSSVAGVWFQA
jgi:hypothetical protein